jgi:hypothetical protein
VVREIAVHTGEEIDDECLTASLYTALLDVDLIRAKV